jgi:hypothetical protein
VTLSSEAIKDLKIALRKSYGSDFGVDLSEEEFNHLGEFLMTCLMEVLKNSSEESS